MTRDRESEKPEQNPIEKGNTHRRRILEAALTLFMRKGFHQTSMRDIARGAGVSLGNAYNHFAGKRDLILAVAALESGEQDSLIAALRAAPDRATALSGFVDAFYRGAANQETAAITAEILAESLRDPEIGAAFSENRQRLADALTEALCPGDAGTADALIDLVEGRALRDVLDGRATAPVAPADLHRMAERLCRRP